MCVGLNCSGCTLAKARCVKYRSISVRNHHNISKKWIRELFDRAKETAPSIIFFDEFDSLTSVSAFPGTRGSITYCMAQLHAAPGTLMNRVTSQIVTALDALQV
ncbi:MAG: hypothetical protein CMB73_05715 [Euryarchaeota archaeon]|jgi:SpoVK/Ycf46/Vps4 family AAA+-type ATPase|nr:hypothetical protein [Euryarchaeota archaeon]|tara:strand:- start:714 stop:1025 length:312 start_codon:yes stop_codon:yes gene_type:complete